MSVFVRYQGRFIKELCGSVRGGVIKQSLKYSQQKPSDPVVTGKKKYLYTAILGASLFGFGYYINKEREYGTVLICFLIDRDKKMMKNARSGKRSCSIVK